MNWVKDGLHIRSKDVTVFPKLEEDKLVGYSWVSRGRFAEQTFYKQEDAIEDALKHCEV